MKFKIKFKFPFKKIRDFFKCHCFGIAGVIFILLMLANLIIYVAYVSLPVGRESKIEIKQEAINEGLLQQAVDNLNVRSANLERVERNSYPDPFK